MAPPSALSVVVLFLSTLPTPALASRSTTASLSPGASARLGVRHTQTGRDSPHAGLARKKRQAVVGAVSSSGSSAVASVETTSTAAEAAGAVSSSSTVEPAAATTSSTTTQAVVPTTTTTTTTQPQPTTTTTTEPAQAQTTTTTTTTPAATTKTTTPKAASSTSSTSVVSVVVVTAVITNSNGALTTSISSHLTTPSATSTAAAKTASSSSSTGKTWGIIGGVAGGVVALLGLLFIGYRLSQRRFSNLDDAGGGGEIRWPQLQMEGQMVAAGASTLRPMGTRRTGGAGVEMDGDQEEEASEWHGSEGKGGGGGAGRSTEHLNNAIGGGYQDGYVLGNDVYSGRPPPSSSVSDHGYPTGVMPAYPPAVMGAGQYPQQPHSQYAQSATGTAPPSFAQHHGHQNFIPSYPRPGDQRGDATFEFMTGHSDHGHGYEPAQGQGYDHQMAGPGLHRNPSSFSNGSGDNGAQDLHRNNSAYSQQTQLPPFTDGLSRSGSGYSFAQQGYAQGQAQPMGMDMAGPGLHRNDTVFSEGSVYSRQTHAQPHGLGGGQGVPVQRVASPRAPSPRY